MMHLYTLNKLCCLDRYITALTSCSTEGLTSSLLARKHSTHQGVGGDTEKWYTACSPLVLF